MNELTQLVALMREMNERLKRIEENTRPSVVGDGRLFDYGEWTKPLQTLDSKAKGTVDNHIMHYPADFDGAHHVTEPK